MLEIPPLAQSLVRICKDWEFDVAYGAEKDSIAMINDLSFLGSRSHVTRLRATAITGFKRRLIFDLGKR